MKLSQDLVGGSYRIRSYQPGQVTINNEVIETSVVISPDELIRDWPPQSLDELTVEHMERVKTLAPELVLLGTGEQQRFPDRTLLRELFRRGIGVEVMDTAAASRTYNVLVAEGRRVVAALLLR